MTWRHAIEELLPLLCGRDRQMLRARFGFLDGGKYWDIVAIRKEFGSAATDPPLGPSGVVEVVGPAVPKDHR